MKTPGEMLREARVEKGLSLSDAAAMTRISRTMLAHLERDRFDEFNADVFVRGHLGNYARELSISVAEILQAYERHIGASSASLNPASPRPGAERKSPRRKNGRSSADPRSTDQQSVAGKSAARPPRTSMTAPVARGALKQSAARDKRLQAWAAKVGPTHAVAVLLVLVGVVVFASLLSGNRATAKDAAQYPTANREAWELEQDVEETRWLLEQPVQAAEPIEAAHR